MDGKYVDSVLPIGYPFDRKYDYSASLQGLADQLGNMIVQTVSENNGVVHGKLCNFVNAFPTVFQ